MGEARLKKMRPTGDQQRFIGELNDLVIEWVNEKQLDPSVVIAVMAHFCGHLSAQAPSGNIALMAEVMQKNFQKGAHDILANMPVAVPLSDLPQ